jgi:protein-disulfide isomerase
MIPMKPFAFLACAAAALAVTACNKSAEQGSAPAADDTVKITQANPPPGGNWTDVVNETAAGFMMGNPSAKVKLIEIGALTCPHCRAFDEEGVPTLVDKYVKSGQVSWEFRPYLLHGLDLPTNLIARCNGTKSFFPLARALYHDQPDWIGKIQTVPQDKLEQVQNLPINQQFVQLASLAGLQDWAAARGVPQDKANQCLRDENEVNKLVQLSSDVPNQFPDFPGTPTFVINGKMLKETASWDKLRPQLDEALK